MQLIWKDLTAQEGLELTGQGNAARGHVMVSVGVIKVKHYAFRRRTKDNRVRTIRGPLVKARACYGDGALLSVIFEV